MTDAELKAKLEKSVGYLKSELVKIRTGRASPALFDDVRADAYGAAMTVKELAAVSVLDAQTIVISPWDKSLLKAMESAIRASNLGLNPVVDGDVIRVAIPHLTEESRKEFAKMVSAKAEDCRQTVRNIRQDAMKDIDKRFANKEIGEDGKFSFRDKVEEVVKQTNAQIDNLGEAKKKDLMAV
ncbi:MAG: Ribosome-recycling factor [candidate division WWE3 bacterium GW2011_GWA1_46_21]|uniref:Ribosome-recycling factor n=2 Tax=Katanobacteria TaxID=422282 RepID=A0A0G1PBH6_UNCKA|nr:MAG: Ribosome-recycling factor [candidate division WWE3 bacterium GW2011_GWA1_46_21]KKU49651.1 MAG: Ribosome-recycling factor [candidate division WWE3 bacterium GW2011_GWC1_47_10]